VTGWRSIVLGAATAGSWWLATTPETVTVAQRDRFRSARAPRSADVSADGRSVAFESLARLVPAPTIVVTPSFRSCSTTDPACSKTTNRPSPLMPGLLLSPIALPASALTSVTCLRARSSTYTSPALSVSAGASWE